MKLLEKQEQKDPISSIRDYQNDSEEVNENGDFDEALKIHVSQISFFLGITYRQLGLFDDAILAYQMAIQLNHFYSDCYFNLGNIFFEEKHDYGKAELCYKSALDALDEERKIQMYKHIEDRPHLDQVTQQNSPKKFYEGN